MDIFTKMVRYENNTDNLIDKFPVNDTFDKEYR